MMFTQYYLDCLSHASYLIGDESTGRAVVVDPRRDIDEYLADAAVAGLTIELIIETHFHADFLSGHLELSAATGAAIAYGSMAETEFDSRKLADGERIELGAIGDDGSIGDGVVLEIRHTPGHTPESISIVVHEHQNDDAPYAVLTGDTLFIGDVGRPDLLSSIGFTSDELANQLYDSLHERLLPLPDETRVYPAHGAGSACGKNLSTDTWSTMGQQRTENYALLAPDRQTFVDLVTEGQPPAPDYFIYDAVLNRKERPLLDEAATPPALALQEVMDLVSEGAALVDARSAEDFARGHVVGAVNVGLEGRFAEYTGSVIGSDVDIVLVTDHGFEREAKNRLGRIGFDRVVGHLANPIESMIANPESVERSSRLTARDVAQRCDAGAPLQLVDVRNPGEVALGSIAGAAAIPVSQLGDVPATLDPDAPTVVFCAGGYRSSIAASLLRRSGFTDVSDIIGGYTAWTEVQTADAAS